MNVKIISCGLCKLFGEEDNSGPGFWGHCSLTKQKDILIVHIYNGPLLKSVFPVWIRSFCVV